MTVKKKAPVRKRPSRAKLKTPAAKLAAAMKKGVDYVGTKMIQAVPMTRGEYNILREWELPKDEDGTDSGYMVIYPGETQPNGKPYVSWSPTKPFEKAYEKNGELSFGAAVLLMKQGFKMARKGWNGKGMFVLYVPGSKKVTLAPDSPYAKALKRKTVDILPHFDMFTATRQMQPGWLASQSDIDANDWCIVK